MKTFFAKECSSTRHSCLTVGADYEHCDANATNNISSRFLLKATSSSCYFATIFINETNWLYSEFEMKGRTNYDFFSLMILSDYSFAFITN